MNSQIFNVDCITSKSNSTIVRLSKLSNKKARHDEKLFMLDGVKLFLEAYEFSVGIKYIILRNDSLFDDEILEKIKKLKNKMSLI